MLGRRRPLIRGAIVGGAAYYAGKRRAQNQAQEEQAAADQETAQENAQTSTGNKGGESKSTTDKITELQKLHDSGTLTDEEFAKAKEKLISEL